MARTVKVRVAVIYNDKGAYQAGGYAQKDQLNDDRLVDDAKENTAYLDFDDLPHTCIVEIELPIPGPLKGKVTNIKQVKP